MGFSVQYKGNPSRRAGSLRLLWILKKFFLNPLYDCWKSVKSTLPATPLKLTHIFFPGFLTSKKERKVSTNGVRPRL